MSEVKDTPYSHFSMEDLVTEIDMTEIYMTAHNDQLAWALEHDTESGLIEALEEGLRHADMDYSWMRREMENRGYTYDNILMTWKLRA